MKKLFYSMIVVFVAVSIIGMLLTGIYLYSVSREMTLLIDSNVSLLKRSELSIETEKLREELFLGNNDGNRFSPIINKIETMLDGCGGCHHGDTGDEKISKMVSLVEAMKGEKRNDADIRTYINRFHGLAHDSMFSGQRLVSERVKKAISDAKKSWGIFIVNLIIGLGVVFSLSVFFIRRFDRGIKHIMRATEAIRRGERIKSEMFGSDLRSVTESMDAMQSELLIKEEKLINWAKQWQTAFNSVDSMMALCDMDGTVIIVNNAFNNVFGTDEGIEGKSWHKVVCLENENVEDCAIARTLKDGDVYSEISNYKDMILSVKTFPVKSEGAEGISGVLWIGRDITKEKQLEERAIQSEKLVALGELVAGIAHEINNPLSAVVGFSEILKDSGKLGKEETQKIEKIYFAAIRVSRIIKNLLEFSRKKPSEFSNHNINTIAEKVIELKEYEMHVENIEIIKDFSDVPSVLCDMTQIQQVILNLVNNAHHAITEKGGEGVISLKTYSDDENVFLEVSDSGVGIAEDVANRIYEPFFTTKDVGKGTGLGLSIVYSALKAHGGDIKIESVPGEGSTFTVSLPIQLQEHM